MLTVEQAAEHFKVTTRSIRRWIKNGEIKASKIGGVIRISEEEIKRLEKGEK